MVGNPGQNTLGQKIASLLSPGLPTPNKANFFPSNFALFGIANPGQTKVDFLIFSPLSQTKVEFFLILSPFPLSPALLFPPLTHSHGTTNDETSDDEAGCDEQP